MCMRHFIYLFFSFIFFLCRAVKLFLAIVFYLPPQVLGGICMSVCSRRLRPNFGFYFTVLYASLFFFFCCCSFSNQHTDCVLAKPQVHTHKQVYLCVCWNGVGCFSFRPKHMRNSFKTKTIYIFIYLFIHTNTNTRAKKQLICESNAPTQSTTIMHSHTYISMYVLRYLYRVNPLNCCIYYNNGIFKQINCNIFLRLCMHACIQPDTRTQPCYMQSCYSVVRNKTAASPTHTPQHIFTKLCNKEMGRLKRYIERERETE